MAEAHRPLTRAELREEIRLAVDVGERPCDIARRLGIPRGTVYARIHRDRIAAGYPAKKRPPPIDEATCAALRDQQEERRRALEAVRQRNAEIVARYVAGESIAYLATRYGLRAATVKEYIKLARRAAGAARPGTRRAAYPPELDAWWSDGVTLAEMARRCGVTLGRLAGYIQYHRRLGRFPRRWSPARAAIPEPATPTTHTCARLLRLAWLFRTAGVVDPGVFAAAVGRDRRTVKRDLVELRALGWSIEWDARRSLHILHYAPEPRLL